jgi:hypothetical protein
MLCIITITWRFVYRCWTKTWPDLTYDDIIIWLLYVLLHHHTFIVSGYFCNNWYYKQWRSCLAKECFDLKPFPHVFLNTDIYMFFPRVSILPMVIEIILAAKWLSFITMWACFERTSIPSTNNILKLGSKTAQWHVARHEFQVEPSVAPGIIESSV